MNGTVAKSFYPTRLNIFIDDQLASTYINAPSSIAQSTNRTNFRYLTTFADIGGLAPGQHTFRAESIGADCLFVLDSISYEPSDTPPTDTAPATSGASLDIQATPSEFANPSSTSTPSSTPSATGGQLSVTTGMDITPSDARITYSPPDHWIASPLARRSLVLSRRATSCHDGTRTAVIAGDSLTYDFTGRGFPYIQHPFYLVQTPLVDH